MHILFILTELPYPATRNGVALISHELLRAAPPTARIDLLITGAAEPDDQIERLRALSPSINQIDFTGEPLSRVYRVGNLISGAIFGRNLFTQRGVRRYFKGLHRLPAVTYVAPLMAGLDFGLARPLFLNAVDSFARFNENAFLRTGRLSDWLKMSLYRLYEKRALKSAAAINFVSSADFQYVRSRGPKLPLINISNGVNSTQFSPDGSSSVPDRLLFTGNFDYAPNAQAAQHFVQNIFPLIRAIRPTTTLQIVGRNPPRESLDYPGVFVTGFVEDIASCYRSAQVYVCPLLSGAGVKNKMFEALASGLPVVTTSLGVEGIDHLEAGRHYILADDVPSFAKHVLAVLEDERLRRSLGQQARAVITQHHNWTPIVERYFEALKMVAWEHKQVVS